MTREDLERDIYEESHNLDFQFIPWSNKKVVRLIIEKVYQALEEAAKHVAEASGNTFASDRIRALKINE